MISNYLSIFKSFGSDVVSITSESDIAHKETELGIRLPKAVRDLYLLFNPEDSIFSSWLSLVPLSQLQTTSIHDSAKALIVVKFFYDDRFSYAFPVSQWSLKDKKLLRDYHNQDDPIVVAFYTNPSTKRESESLSILPDHCSNFILSCMGFMQVYSQPSIITINSNDFSPEEENRFRENRKKQRKKNGLTLLADSDKMFVNILYTPQPVLEVFSIVHPISIAVFDRAYGAQTDAALEKLIDDSGLPYHWLKTQTKHTVFKRNCFNEPIERQLLSIEPILQVLQNFIGEKGSFVSNDDILHTESSLEISFPTPLKELYRYLPPYLYQSNNILYPLSILDKKKDGIVCFLEENQAVYRVGVKNMAPFAYICTTNKSKWNRWYILDGYLVAVYFWQIACCGNPDLYLWEFPHFELNMLEKEGLLHAHLKNIGNISQKVAVGSCFQLYQSIDEKSILLCNSEDVTLFVLSKSKVSSEEFLCTLGIPVDSINE